MYLTMHFVASGSNKLVVPIFDSSMQFWEIVTLARSLLAMLAESLAQYLIAV